MLDEAKLQIMINHLKACVRADMAQPGVSRLDSSSTIDVESALVDYIMRREYKLLPRRVSVGQFRTEKTDSHTVKKTGYY